MALVFREAWERAGGAIRLLGRAAQRGVDVRLSLQGRTDMPLARHAGHGNFAELLGSGVRVFEYQPAILHAKTLVVDDYVSIIGSSNLDFRSFYFHAECNVLTDWGTPWRGTSVPCCEQEWGEVGGGTRSREERSSPRTSGGAHNRRTKPQVNPVWGCVCRANTPWRGGLRPPTITLVLRTDGSAVPLHHTGVKPSLRRLSKSLGLGLGGTVPAAAVLLLIFGKSVLNGYGKSKIEDVSAAAGDQAGAIIPPGIVPG